MSVVPRGGLKLVAAILVLSSCGPAPLLRLTRSGATDVALQVRDGARINARLAPALEFTDGSVVRIESGHRDAAGDYFIGAPHARVTAPRGTPVVIRASVCVDDERLCRTISEHAQLP